MAQYEFSEQESQVIAAVARRCITQAILLGLVGLIAVVTSLVAWGRLSLTVSLAQLARDLVYIFMGVLFFRPADNFKRVATTQGNDITEVMQGLRDLDWGFKTLAILLGLLLVLNVARSVLLA